MSSKEKLNEAIRYINASAFILSNFQYLPIPLPFFSIICRFLSLGLYLCGNAIWFFSTKLARQQNETYRQMHFIASMTAGIATAISIVGVFIPQLLLFSAGIAFLGNVIWACSERYKLQHPPQEDAQYSANVQNYFTNYSIASSFISLVTVISSIAAFIFPPFTLSITLFTVMIYAGIGAYIVDVFGKMKIDEVVPVKSPINRDISPTIATPNVEPTPDHAAPIHSNIFSRIEIPGAEAAPSVEPTTDDVTPIHSNIF